MFVRLKICAVSRGATLFDSGLKERGYALNKIEIQIKFIYSVRIPL